MVVIIFLSSVPLSSLLNLKHLQLAKEQRRQSNLEKKNQDIIPQFLIQIL